MFADQVGSEEVPVAEGDTEDSGVASASLQAEGGATVTLVVEGEVEEAAEEIDTEATEPEEAPVSESDAEDSVVATVEVEDEACKELARRARGTPRIANRLLRRVRDFAHHLGTESVTLKATTWGLEQMEVDGFGLDHLDRRILTTIIEVYGGGPVGLKALAASLGEDRGTLEDINEPYLLQIGMLQRTPRGRAVTAAAYRHLGLTPPGSASPLFEESD